MHQTQDLYGHINVPNSSFLNVRCRTKQGAMLSQLAACFYYISCLQTECIQQVFAAKKYYETTCFIGNFSNLTQQNQRGYPAPHRLDCTMQATYRSAEIRDQKNRQGIEVASRKSRPQTRTCERVWARD